MSAAKLPESVQRKLDIVGDAMLRVAVGSSPGCLVYGPGGHGKSFAVRQTMQRYPLANYVRHGTSATGRGLFQSFAQYPNGIHVIEDMEDVFKGKTLNLLRESLWGERDILGRMTRPIHWETNRGIEVATFTGGVIVVSNADLNGDDPILRAVASRVKPVYYALSDDELIQMFSYIASFGYTGHVAGKKQTMAAGECAVVAEWIADLCKKEERVLDLRNFSHACDYYLMERSGHAAAPWRDSVANMIRAKVTTYDTPRDELRLSKAWTAWQLRKLPRSERNRLWRKQTGETEMSYSRYLNRARKMGFPSEE